MCSFVVKEEKEGKENFLLAPNLKKSTRTRKLLLRGQNRIPDFTDFLAGLKEGARFADKPKGYVIGAIKRKLKEI